MINNIKIQNYKSISECDLDLLSFTILTGKNSSGKSSVLQAILASVIHCGLSGRMVVDEYAYSRIQNLIAFNNIRNKKLNSDKVNIYIDNNLYCIERDKFRLYTSSFMWEENFYYLPANRESIKSIDYYQKDIKFGLYGEFVSSYFEGNKDKVINLYGDNEIQTMKYNLGFWIERILDIKFSLITNKLDTMHVISKFMQDDIGYEFEITNVSTGLIFLTKILVIGLSLKKGDILVIENPEIHLHPKAVSRLVEFFAFLVKNGIQVILETHSDTLINKTRYLVYKKELDSNCVVIYYKDNIDSGFEQVLISDSGYFANKNGEKRAFPQGFLDVGLAELMEIR
nr:AAA family ATPase [uncultured Campylobacter sp.]